jgi:hypothetical protein
VHAIVTGGGLSPDGARWLPARRRYLFPVEVMGALFRGKLLAALDTAMKRGEVEIPGGKATDPEAWDHLRDRLHRMRWNVYAKRPFGGAAQVIRYLGRYTHRVGISNHRLVTRVVRKTGLAMEWKKWAVEWPSYGLTEPERGRSCCRLGGMSR